MSQLRGELVMFARAVRAVGELVFRPLDSHKDISETKAEAKKDKALKAEYCYLVAEQCGRGCDA